MERKFLLIAYKPNSDDYCRGCLMESYPSDFILEEIETKEYLIQRIAEIQSRLLGTGEDGYEIHFFEGDSKLEVEEQQEIEEEAGIAMIALRQKALEAELAKAKMLEAEHRKDAEDKERAELARLQAKYGSKTP